MSPTFDNPFKMQWSLLSNQEAEEYLRKCVAGLPLAWWTLYLGPSILDVLKVLGKTTNSNGPPSSGKPTRHAFLPPGKPSPIAFLAYCLHVKSQNGVVLLEELKIIENAGGQYGLFKIWNPEVEGCPVPLGGFCHWVATMTRSKLMPVDADKGLGEGSVAFRSRLSYFFCSSIFSTSRCAPESSAGLVSLVTLSRRGNVRIPCLRGRRTADRPGIGLI